MKKIISIIIILLTISNFAFAENYVSTSRFKIKSYMIDSAGDLFIEFTEDPPGIEYNDRKWWGNHAIIRKEHESFNAMVASVISAYLFDLELYAIHHTMLKGWNAAEWNDFEGCTFMNISTFRVLKN